MILVHTLGTALIDAGRWPIKPTSPRKFALLLYLSAERGRRIPRSFLQELIFPNQAERNARHSLRELVYQLRQLGVSLNAGPDGVELLGSEVRADYDQILSAQTIEREHVLAATGGFLPGYSPTHSEAFTEWYEVYRARSISAISRAFLRAVGRARNAGDWEATELAGRACLALDSLNEEATLALAEMLALGGAKAKAVKLLDAYMGEVGRISPEIQLPAKLLRRRIDQVPDPGPVRGSPKFVGRSEEMATLRGLLRNTGRYEAHCVVLSGEPGIGKSRLLSEFRSIAELEGVRCEQVAMQPHDVGRPMGAFVDLVPSLLQLPGALGCSPASMERLRRLVGTPMGAVSEFNRSVEPEITALATTGAIGDLCESISAEQPLGLIIEDVHSLDEFSIRTLSALVSSRHRCRILVLVSTREPRNLLKIARHSERWHHLHLAPLVSDATTALIEELLSRLTTTVTPYVRTRLAELANGNPLFAILLAAHYAETGESGGVPPTLIESLTRRLEPLPRISL
jgi:DNA-binding SARP family transcriptional activator